MPLKWIVTWSCVFEVVGDLVIYPHIFAIFALPNENPLAKINTHPSQTLYQSPLIALLSLHPPLLLVNLSFRPLRISRLIMLIILISFPFQFPFRLLFFVVFLGVFDGDGVCSDVPYYYGTGAVGSLGYAAFV